MLEQLIMLVVYAIHGNATVPIKLGIDPLSQVNGTLVIYCPGTHCTANVTMTLPNMCTGIPGGTYDFSSYLALRFTCTNPTASPVLIDGSSRVILLVHQAAPANNYATVVAVAAGASGIALLTYLALERAREGFVLSKYLSHLGAPWVAARIKRTGGKLDPQKEKIIQFLSRAKAASLYEISRALGMSYGSTQWHIYVLERMGKVSTRKVLGKVYAYIDEREGLGKILSELRVNELSGEDLRKVWDLVTRAMELGILRLETNLERQQ